MLQEKCFILNKTRDTCLASEAELARSAYRRMKGLIGRSIDAFAEGKGLWIVPSNGIHTFGMSFPIDVAYLDSRKRVLKLYHQLRPFRVAAVMFKARSVLELPPGTLANTQTQVGDILEIQPIEQSHPKDGNTNPPRG